MNILTGPLEGFFVGSVEFCKFKFNDNDRKDDKRGTQKLFQGLKNKKYR